MEVFCFVGIGSAIDHMPSNRVSISILEWYSGMVVGNLLVVCMLHHGLVAFRLVFVVRFPEIVLAISIRYFAFPISPIHSPNSMFVHVSSFDIWWQRFYFVRVFVFDDLHLRESTVGESNNFPLVVFQTKNSV